MSTQTTTTPTAGSGSGRSRRMLLALLVVGVALLALPALASATQSTSYDGVSTDFGYVVPGTTTAPYAPLLKFSHANSICSPIKINCDSDLNDTITLNPTSLEGTGFHIASNSCGPTWKLPQGTGSNNCAIGFTGNPPAFGKYSTNQTVSWAGTTSGTKTMTFTMIGARTPTGPSLTFVASQTSTTPITAENFGPTAQFQPLDFSYWVFNTGNAAITGVNNASFTGTNAADFSITQNTCPATLQPGISCQISTHAVPTGIGPESATLQAGGSPATVNLPYTLDSQQAVFSGELRDTSATTIRPAQDFGTVTAPSTPSYSYKLKNTGNEPMTGANNVSITGAKSATTVFDQTNDCPATLPASQTCTITVFVNTRAIGDLTAQLNVGTTNMTIAPSTLHVNIDGVVVANDLTTDAGGKRWLETPTIGDASAAGGVAAATPNNDVRISLDVPHTPSFRPSQLQISSSSGGTAPAAGGSSWQDVSTADIRQLPGAGNRTQVEAAFQAASYGWSGGTTGGTPLTAVLDSQTTSLAGLVGGALPAGVDTVPLPRGVCAQNGLGTGVSSGTMWFRLRDSNFAYSQPFSTVVKTSRTTWQHSWQSSADDLLFGTQNLSNLSVNIVIGTVNLHVAWPTGDCTPQGPGVTARGITAVGSTPYQLSDAKEDVETTPGTPVTFGFAGHGGTFQFNGSQTANDGCPVVIIACSHGTKNYTGPATGAAHFTGIQWRARNVATGQIVPGGTVNFANSADNATQSIQFTPPSRGRWIVEGVPQGDNGTTVTGAYNYIGSVVANAAPAPSLTLSGVPANTRLLSNHNYTLTATSADVDPLGSTDPFGGLVSTIEWDLDNDHTNGPGGDGYEARVQASPYVGLSPSELTHSFDTTGLTPGPYEVCARVSDNGGYDGADKATHTTHACTDFTINAAPAATDKTVDIEADDGQPANFPLAGTDADADPVNVTVASQTHGGTASQGAGSSANYGWPITFAGTDQFVVVAHDDHNGTGNGTLTVNVHPSTDVDASGAPHGSGPTNAAQTRGATFAFSSPQQATNVNSFECRLLTDPTSGTDFGVVEGQDWAACNSGTKVYNGLDDGTYRFEVRAITSGGLKDLTPAAYTWRVDTTKPQVVYHSAHDRVGPGGALFTNDTTPDYTFTSDDASPQEADTYECRFPAGEGPWVSCGDPVGSSGSSAVSLVGPLFGISDPLTEGQYQVEVRSTDEAGNVSDAVTRTFTVDTTPPTTSIVSGPEGLINTRDIAYSVISNEAGSSFVCQLGARTDDPDPGGWLPCPGSIGAPTYTGLADGLYTFFVKAIDPAGNIAVDDPVASTDFEVDATPPETTVGELRDGNDVLLTGPEASSQSRKATITFTGADSRLLHGFECRLDSSSDEAWQTCQSPENYGGLADGHHEVDVRAIDDAQNRDPSAVVYQWYVDRTPPSTSFDDAPGAYDNDTTPTITWHATDNVSTSGFSYQCTIDGSSWSTCDTPFDAQSIVGHPLADGPHTLSVRATDPAGNQETTPATLSWVVDTVAPAIELTAHPHGPIAPAGPADFGFRALDGSPPAAAPELKTECATDEDLSTDPSGWTWTTCSSPYEIATPSDGDHTFAVRSVDAAGNGSTPATFSWTVDATPPDAPHIDSSTPHDGALTAATDATVAFSLADEDHINYQCRLDGAPWQDCPQVDNTGTGGSSQSPYTVTGLDDGEHQIDIRAIDDVGNVSPVSSLSWTVDHNLPSTHIDAGPSGTVRSADASFSFSSNEAGNTFECKVDGAAWTACPSPLSLTGLSEGQHSLAVRAVKGDVAPLGLKDPSPQTRTWTVDTTAPTVTIGDKPPASSGDKDAHFTFSSDDAGATLQCSLDGGDFDTCTSPLKLTVAAGDHVLKVRAVDAAGNVSTPGDLAGWTVTEPAPPGNWVATLTGGTLTFQGLGGVDVPADALKLNSSIDNGVWRVPRAGVIVNPIVQNVDIAPGVSATLSITLSALQDGLGSLPSDLHDGPASFDISLQVKVSAKLGNTPIITEAQNCTIGPLALHGVGTYTEATQTIHIADANVHVPAAGSACGAYGGTVNTLLHLPADGNGVSFDFKLTKQEDTTSTTTTTPTVTTSVTQTRPHTTTTVVTPPAVASLGKVSTKVPSTGKVKVPVWCVGRSTQTCAGSISLTAKLGTKTSTLGKATYKIKGGKSKTLTVTLSKAAKTALKKAKKGIKAKLVNAPTAAKKTTKSVTLKRATATRSSGAGK